MATEAEKARLGEATRALAAVIEDYADVLGPQVCTEHGDECEMDTDVCSVKPSDVTMLRGWVMLTEWSELSGMGSLEYMMPMEQPLSMTIGLIEAGKRIIFNDMLGR